MDIFVSVAVCTYNRPASLRESLNAILNQTFNNYELIVVDDCSDFDIESIVNDFRKNSKHSIKYIRHDVNRGLTYARNTAISNSEGLYFSFCDDDDIWKEDFLQEFCRASKRFPNHSLCSGRIANSNIRFIKGAYRQFLFMGFTPPVASQFYLMKDIIEVGCYDMQVTSGVDHDLWLSLATYGKNLVWINKSFVKVSEQKISSRMTWNAHKRVNGIKASLKLWEERHGDSLGHDYIKDLAKNYKYYMHKRFLRLSLESFNISFIYHLASLNIFLIVKDVFRYVRRKVTLNNERLMSTFFSFRRCELQLIKDD
jgi:glycosyltransferase involved in cell wall biosynthesis